MNPSDSGVPLQLLSASLEAVPVRAKEARRQSPAGRTAAAEELVLAVDAELRIVAANAPMLACLGRDESAVLGARLGEVLNDELAIVGLEAYAAKASGRQMVCVESLPPRPGALPIRYRLSFVPIDAGGRLASTGTGIALVCSGHPIVAEAGIDAAMVEASTREQLRLGHDLHDTLGQELATTLLLIAGLEKRIADSAPELLPKSLEIRSAITQALESMRSVVRGLVPSGLESGGLSRTLAELAARCGRNGKPRFEFSGPDTLPPLPGGAAEHIYRFAQEAVSNIVRHAKASAVDMRLSIEDPDLVLTVCDDGAGFDPDKGEGQGGMGLRIMRHRARSIGGRLAVESNSVGTRIALRVPLDQR